MFGALTSLTGGGGISASGGKAESGDAASDLTGSFQYNAAFQVGGSGTQKQRQAADSGTGNTPNSNTLLYVGIGVVALIGLAVLVRR